MNNQRTIFPGLYAKLRDRMNTQYWKFYWRGGYDEAFRLCRAWESWWDRFTSDN